MPTVIHKALASQSITSATPIQEASIPDALSGRDVLGRGRTGSGKTLAFGVPLVARLMEEKVQPRRPHGLVLVPTRELADQVATALAPLLKVCGLWSLAVYGGVSYGPQKKRLDRGVDIVVATPGRLADLVRQGAMSLDAIQITVLDEADQMSDMGFLPEVSALLDQTPPGQRMLFSATLDGAVGKLTERFLVDPVTHHTDDETSPVETMDHHVLQIKHADRVSIVQALCRTSAKTVVFTRTKHGAKRLATQLNSLDIPTVDLHGDLSQAARNRNLEAFRESRATTLVATDVAARGIHVDDVEVVVHADPPAEHKAYLHRSGRTARAGSSGTVVTMSAERNRGTVRRLMREADISPTVTTNVGPEHPILRELVPGETFTVDGGYLHLPEPRGRRRRPTDAGHKPPRGRNGRGSGGRGGDRDFGRDRKLSGTGGRREDDMAQREAELARREAQLRRRENDVRRREQRDGHGEQRYGNRAKSYSQDEAGRGSRGRDDRSHRVDREGRSGKGNRSYREERAGRSDRFDRDDRADRGSYQRKSRQRDNDWAPRDDSRGWDERPQRSRRERDGDNENDWYPPKHRKTKKSRVPLSQKKFSGKSKKSKKSTKGKAKGTSSTVNIGQPGQHPSKKKGHRKGPSLHRANKTRHHQ